MTTFWENPIWFLGEKIKKGVPTVAKGYAFHVERGSRMVFGYAGKTVGAGAGAAVGGLAGGLTKGFMPAAKKSYGAAGGYDPVTDFKARAAALTPSGDKSLIHFPDIVIPDFPKIPEFPKFTLPKIPEGGLVNIGKLPDFDIAGGLELPKLPSFGFTDEEGDANPLMIAALAIGGFYLIRKVV